MTGTWLDRNRHLVFISLVLIALGGGAIFYMRQPAAHRPIEIQQTDAVATVTVTPDPTATATPAPVRVYVTGAVVNSDVYFLPAGSIIKDAIAAAGGFSADADPERINQALELKDQQQIHVPRLGEEDAPPAVQDAPARIGDQATGQTVSAGGSSLNLNTATLEQLDELPGIGPAIAERIITYRENVGGFQSIEEITQVSGIGNATFDKIKDRITVE